MQTYELINQWTFKVFTLPELTLSPILLFTSFYLLWSTDWLFQIKNYQTSHFKFVFRNTVTVFNVNRSLCYVKCSSLSRFL